MLFASLRIFKIRLYETHQLEKQKLIDGIRRGDSAIIKRIYEDYHQAIVHMVETNSGTAEDAHDVFQEGLVVFYQKVKDPDFTLSSKFLTYFYAICRNIWSNRLRKKTGREMTLEDNVQDQLVDDTLPVMENTEQYYLYRKMFLRLGEDCQKVLRLFLRKIDMATITKQMGYSSVNYTKKRKFKCKEKLVKLIKADRSYHELTEK